MGNKGFIEGRGELRQGKIFDLHPPPTLPAVGNKGFIEGGGKPREGKIFDLHFPPRPPPVVSSARKGKKAERSSGEDAKLVAVRQGL